MEFVDQRQQYEEELNQELPDPRDGARTVNQDQSFMKWLFDFKKDIEPLSYSWRGYELDTSTEKWLKNVEAKPIMNDRGVNWGISYIQSFLTSVHIVSNIDANYMNHIMRNVVRSITNHLCKNYKKYNLEKSNIERIIIEIEAKILSILLGARGDGYRNLFAKQYHVHEAINNQTQQMQQQKTGVVNRMMSMFNRRDY